MLNFGEYAWEIRDGGAVVARETASLAPAWLSGARRSADGTSLYQARAQLNSQGAIERIEVRYRRGPFSRSAAYQASSDFLGGTLTALSGHSTIQTRLGRFREVDGDLVIFKVLIIAHLRARGQDRWTGRVASVDPATLLLSSPKQTYRQIDAGAMVWSFEPAIGERERIELDREGRIVRRVDVRGVETVAAALGRAGPETAA